MAKLVMVVGLVGAIAAACGTDDGKPRVLDTCRDLGCTNIGLCTKAGVCACTLDDGEHVQCTIEHKGFPDAGTATDASDRGAIDGAIDAP